MVEYDKNRAMICINDLYFEDTEDMRKLSLFILQLEREKFFYESGYRKVLKTNELLARKNKKLYTKAHVYKVEMNNLVRKLTRIYKQLYYSYLLSGYKSSYADKLLKHWKNI